VPVVRSERRRGTSTVLAALVAVASGVLEDDICFIDQKPAIESSICNDLR